MAVSVDVIVKDDAVSPQPVEGVTVALFDSNTAQQVAAAVSDASGRASFLLPGGADPGMLYEARFFKAGVLFPRVAGIYVLEPVAAPATNAFDVTGTRVGSFGVPLDPRLCRCVGRFVNYMNQPMPNALVRIASDAEVFVKTPKVVDGNMVAPSAMEFHTDQNGFVVLDLFRTGEYWLTFSGEDDEVWDFRVPDRATANLIELIHPQPVSLSFDEDVAPGNAVSLAVGETKMVPVSVLFSDYLDHRIDLGEVLSFENSDPAKADVTFQTNVGHLAIVGRSAGTVEISVTLHPNLLPPRLPDYSLASPTLQVTITP